MIEQPSSALRPRAKLAADGKTTRKRPTGLLLAIQRLAAFIALVAQWQSTSMVRMGSGVRSTAGAPIAGKVMSDLRRRILELQIEHNKRRLKKLDEMIAIADGFLIGSGLILVSILLMSLWAVFFASPV
jgi:hypothetical protein